MSSNSFVNGVIVGVLASVLAYTIYMSITEAIAKRKVHHRSASMIVSEAAVKRMTREQSEDGVFSPRIIIDPILRKSYENE